MGFVSTRKVNYIKAVSAEFEPPTHYLVILDFCFMTLIKMSGMDFRSVLRVTCCPVKKCLKCLMASTIVGLPSQLLSVSVRFLANCVKRRLRVAASVTSEASVSTLKGMLSSVAEITAFKIILYTSCNACIASCDNGNDLQLAIGLIRFE